ncbi:MAG TPA: heavy metal-responsive transcriptional regulator [Acidimicrobiia bacterium]
MKIGEVARRTGTTPKTIRYYEDIGLLPEPPRAPNGYRDYGDETVERLSFIRDAQATGLSLTEIDSILDLRGRGETTCEHVTALLERHMAALDDHMDRLRATRSKLAELTDRAKRLDPAQCVDPIRCQTIGHDLTDSGFSVQIHPGPAEHRH